MFEIKKTARVTALGENEQGIPRVELEFSENFYHEIPLEKEELMNFKMYETITITITGKGWTE